MHFVLSHKYVYNAFMFIRHMWSFFRSDIFVFLLSTRAGGLGINLTAADTVTSLLPCQPVAIVLYLVGDIL